MAAVDRVDNLMNTADAASKPIVKDIMNRAVWAWYEEHKDEVLIKKYIFTIRIRDVRFLIERIAGPAPFPR